MLFKLAGPYWVAPIFAAVLSVLTLGVFFRVKPHTLDTGLGTFVFFLPMAFYMAAAAQVANQKQMRDLQQGIEQVEAKAAR